MAFIGLGGVLVILAGLASVLIPLRFIGIKSRGQGFVVAIVGFMIAGYAANNDTPKSQASSSEPIKAAEQPTPSAPPVPAKLLAAEKAASTMPDAQRQFIAAVEKARVAYNSAINDMQKGATRPARAKGICSALSSLGFDNWVGQVEELSSNNDGYGILSVKIAKDTYVKTWNNAFSDIVDDTLLDPSGWNLTLGALAGRQR
jgi:hypothetical protein